MLMALVQSAGYVVSLYEQQANSGLDDIQTSARDT